MPKVNKLKMSKEAINARERREAEKNENRYNSTLKEYIQFKHSEIIEQFNPFYEDLKSKYPEKRIYLNTKEFRLWRKNEIKKTFASDGVEVVYFDSKDLNSTEQPQLEDNDEQDEEPQVEDSNNNILVVEHNDNEQPQAEDSNNNILVVEHNDNEQPQAEDSNNVLSVAMEQANNEIHNADNFNLAEEIERALNVIRDEGIELDIYNEIQEDKEPFNYGLELELNNLGS